MPLTFHIDNNKTAQIKRYPDAIIKHFRQLYPSTPNYAEQLFTFQSQLLVRNQPIVLGFFGSQTIVELLCLYFLQQNLPEKKAGQIQINAKVFGGVQDKTIISELLQIPDPAWTSTSNTFRNISLLDILGCQRLKFDDNRFVIDYYLGDISHQLNTLPTKNRDKIQAWLISDDNSKPTPSSLVESFARVSEPYASTFSPIHSELSDKLTGMLSAQNAEQNDKNPIENDRPYCPLPQSSSCDNDTPIAVIGGGLASAHLTLSLAERGKSVKVFCKDNSLAEGASGNRQGALYPLLTPENDLLSQFYQQAYLFSRRRIQQLVKEGYKISHDFCGVIQTGHNDRSSARINKILSVQDWPQDIIHSIDAEQANQLAGLNIDKAGAYYPLAGWVCPAEYTRATFAKAQQLSDISIEFNLKITRLEHQPEGWLLHCGETSFGPFEQVVNATGSDLTQFIQTHELPASNFRGQVSHIPTTPNLSKLNAVLCAHGYVTPMHNQHHCIGASYVKDTLDRNFVLKEHTENLEKVQQSYPHQNWLEDIDITENNARVGVRMVTRDHFPMLGCAPDYHSLLQIRDSRKTRQGKVEMAFWKNIDAPVFKGLYILGALGSRGLCSGPLAAETLAALLCDELPPVSYDLLTKMNPNRIWIRKLASSKPL
ncbi:FAD-dependent oxidoreductase [Parashewanella spongiae]|uniref:tRNA 5-methylaminomethyl-2-thiouridine biosynthesis bifunctional protein MnmC n=1 Tax=Parashewanella spongiae TaxID=342950 RepID=A0A3A6UJ73_9GAMM|nr:FAD-dependent 5-carboxymethylaminomethyl-2-thiouridine(34) oxidoreductase MnmC [Parashewanella spongiae]MCL1076910.1 FAD-dependent 5-carboxymethylaminomethyl-2-thiouridine(34) oxidoreductase MnmC [Parashewanella spongiae]RJY19159.1 FAD-dependent oxidoreductase [Parashewanella spongiae]